GVRVPQDMPLQDGVPVRFPVVIKPVNEGSSIDLAIVSGSDEWKAYAVRVRGAPERWLVEERVQGVEVAVGVLEGEALVPVEVRPRRGVYDYTAKYTPGETEYLCPPKLPAETIRRCMQVAEEAVRVCGCRGAPRVDMIVPDGGDPVVLEINTIPGMTETSLLPKAAAASGIGFADLCRRILDGARLEVGQ
ncbi:MAG: ATP-grasp domain-containing protein, partial [Zetaproteobacteria bacterium]